MVEAFCSAFRTMQASPDDGFCSHASSHCHCLGWFSLWLWLWLLLLLLLLLFGPNIALEMCDEALPRHAMARITSDCDATPRPNIKMTQITSDRRRARSRRSTWRAARRTR